MFPSGQAGAKCPLVCSSEDYRPGPAPFSSMLALVKVPWAGDNIKCVKNHHIALLLFGKHSGIVCLSPQALGTGP